MSQAWIAPDARPRLRLIDEATPLESLIGPFYEIELESGWRTALLVQARHLGSDGGAHSAVLLALAERAMRKLAAEQTAQQHCTLAQIGLQVLGRVRTESWLYAEAVVLSSGRTLLFTAADLFDERGPVAMVSAVWQLRQPA